MHWRRFGRLILLGAALASIAACAEEQDPINRVEAYALPKSLFTAEWWYQQTVVDVPATYTVSMVGNTNYRGMHRIRWDIQENYLYARKSYQDVMDGKKTEADPSKAANEDTGEYKGAIVGAWRINKHFDIKRDYNPQTGEENNVLIENSDDCKWYDCKYLRVDWSRNYAVDYMFLDSDEEITKQPGEWYDQDTYDPRYKPVFDAQAGYIDVTTAMTILPGYQTFDDGRSYPLCWLFAREHASCTTETIKIRNSFLRRDPNRDYEPRIHAAPEDEWFGYFTNERLVQDKVFWPTYKNKLKFINRHNLWVQHHYADDFDCSLDRATGKELGTTLAAVQKAADAQCAKAHDGDTNSRCDLYIKFHKYEVATDTDGDGLPDSYEDVMAGLDRNNADSDGDGIPDRSDDADGNKKRDVEDFWKWDGDAMAHHCTIPMAKRDPVPVAYFNTGFFPADLVCDEAKQERDKNGKAVTDTTTPCKPWAWTADTSKRNKEWASLHHISNDYDETFFRTFLRGPFGWTDADYQTWINTRDVSKFSGQKLIDLNMFGDNTYGRYAFTICPNNPVQEIDPWPCRFPHHSFKQAKELIDAGLKFNTMSYEQAKKLMAAGQKDVIEKRKGPYIRHGDIRYSNVNYVKDYYDGWRLLGLGPSHTDPRTGENIAGVANVYALNDWAATRVMETVQLLNGDIKPTEYVNGMNLSNWLDYNKQKASWGTSHSSVTAEELADIYNSMVQPWMKKVSRTGSPELLGLLRQTKSDEQIIREMINRMAKSGMYDPAKKITDISVIKGTQLEKRLIDSDVLMAAGYPPATVKSLSSTVLNHASLARNGGFLSYLNNRADWESDLSHRRNMDFMSMADDAMVGLAFRMAQKYKDYKGMDKANKYWYEARDIIMKAVLTHEMGHTFGMHHNWGGSEDALNYNPTYWKLRTNNGADTTVCTNWKTAKAGDGQLCPFFLKGKEMTKLQLGTDPKYQSEYVDGSLKSMYEYAYSSVMDYAGRYTIDGNGLGRYDKAAIMYGHVDKVEVFVDHVGVEDGLGATRVNVFDSWHSRDGTILFFPLPLYNPTSYHYTNWYAQMGTKMYEESNRELVDYRKVEEYCYPTGSNTPVLCSTLPSTDRSVAGYYSSGFKPRVPYIMCTYTRGDISDGCNTRDFGADQYERMKAHTDDWDTWYLMRNFTRYTFPNPLDKIDDYVTRNYKRVYKRLKDFNNAFALYQGMFRQWFSDTTLQTFFSDPVFGWGAYTKAIHDAFNMALRGMAMPDVKRFEKTTWPDGSTVYKEVERKVDMVTDISNSRYFATSWWDTNNEDTCGLQFWECLHHFGFYLDKMMTLQVLSDPQTYFVARDTAEDIREWRISFFDNFSTQIVDFFGAMLSEDFDKFAPWFDPNKYDPDTPKTVTDNQGTVWINGIAWRNYADSSKDPPKPLGGASVEASTRFTLQLYAIVYGMLEFQQNFDNEFVARGRMWKDGTKTGWSITPNSKTISGLAKFACPFTGATYVGVDYVDNRGIAEKMILHANKMKARTTYCTPKTIPPTVPTPEDECVDGITSTAQAQAETALTDYVQLMDVLVQVTNIYDNVAGRGQNWSNDYQDP